MSGKRPNSRLRDLTIILLLAGILTVPYAFSASIARVILGNAGTIGRDVTANSGSSTDIQAAVNTVASAGGGTVHIPAGNFTFKINYACLALNNGYCGVQIPGGVNVVGAGNNQTILYCPITSWRSGGNTGGDAMFVLDGTNNKPIRISGIEFEGSVNYTISNGYGGENADLVGIVEYGVKDYRIDHCTFVDFDGIAVWLDNNYVLNPNGNCGVVDHCIFDNPYKNVYWNYTGQYSIWGYGIVVCGEWHQIHQKWQSLSSVLGQYGCDIAYIEDCSFRRCRHDIAGGSGAYGWYVARYCNFTDNISEYLGSFCDNHGGGRGYELYNNIFTDVPGDYRSFNPGDPDIGNYYCRGANPRGGSGVIFNNTFDHCGIAVQLSNDQSQNATWRLNQFWIWNNVYSHCGSQLTVTSGSPPYTIVQEVEYYLHAPNASQISYAPYPYPFPLTLGETP